MKDKVLDNFKLDKKMTLELASVYIKDFDKLLKVFGSDCFRNVLETLNFSDFYTLEFVPVDAETDDRHKAEGGYKDFNRVDELNKYLVLGAEVSELTKSYLDVSSNEWDDDISDYDSYYDYVEGYYVKKPKKSEFHAAKGMLKELYPYLKEFNFQVVWGKELIFIECETDQGKLRPALQVPIGALVENDFSMIEKEMRDYYKGYFERNAGPDGKVQNYEFNTIEEALFSLTTDTCQRLQRTLN